MHARTPNLTPLLLPSRRNTKSNSTAQPSRSTPPPPAPPPPSAKSSSRTPSPQTAPPPSTSSSSPRSSAATASRASGSMLTTSPSRPARASSVYLFRRGHLLTVRCGLVTLCFRARLRVHVDLDLDFGHSGETSSTTPIATAPPWQTEYVPFPFSCVVFCARACERARAALVFAIYLRVIRIPGVRCAVPRGFGRSPPHCCCCSRRHPMAPQCLNTRALPVRVGTRHGALAVPKSPSISHLPSALAMCT